MSQFSTNSPILGINVSNLGVPTPLGQTGNTGSNSLGSFPGVSSNANPSFLLDQGAFSPASSGGGVNIFALPLGSSFAGPASFPFSQSLSAAPQLGATGGLLGSSNGTSFLRNADGSTSLIVNQPISLYQAIRNLTDSAGIQGANQANLGVIPPDNVIAQMITAITAVNPSLKGMSPGTLLSANTVLNISPLYGSDGTMLPFQSFFPQPTPISLQNDPMMMLMTSLMAALQNLGTQQNNPQPASTQPPNPPSGQTPAQTNPTNTTTTAGTTNPKPPPPKPASTTTPSTGAKSLVPTSAPGSAASTTAKPVTPPPPPPKPASTAAIAATPPSPPAKPVTLGGQTLDPNNPNAVYTVKSGDSLSKLAIDLQQDSRFAGKSLTDIVNALEAARTDLTATSNANAITANSTKISISKLLSSL